MVRRCRHSSPRWIHNKMETLHKVCFGRSEKNRRIKKSQSWEKGRALGEDLKVTQDDKVGCVDHFTNTSTLIQ